MRIKRYIEQALFVVGTFVSCTLILVLSNYKANASNELPWLKAQAPVVRVSTVPVSVPAREMALQAVATSLPDPGDVTEVCEDPDSQEVQERIAAEEAKRYSFGTNDFATATLLQAKIATIFSPPAPTSPEHCSDEGLKLDPAIQFLAQHHFCSVPGTRS